MLAGELHTALHETLHILGCCRPTDLTPAALARAGGSAYEDRAVALRGSDGAIVTRGRVEERRVDAWDWALALSGIFVARAAARGPRCSKGF